MKIEENIEDDKLQYDINQKGKKCISVIIR